MHQQSLKHKDVGEQMALGTNRDYKSRDKSVILNFKVYDYLMKEENLDSSTAFSKLSTMTKSQKHKLISIEGGKNALG